VAVCEGKNEERKKDGIFFCVADLMVDDEKVKESLTIQSDETL